MTKDLEYTDEQVLTWTVGGLLTSCAGLLLFIKNCAVKFFKKRNNDIERRLTNLEAGQVTKNKK